MLTTAVFELVQQFNDVTEIGRPNKGRQMVGISPAWPVFYC